MMRMLFDYYDTDRLVICLDPNNMDLLKDFYSDRCTTKILEISCNYDDEYLAGHARRVGLAGENTTPESYAQLIPTLSREFAYESDALRDAEFHHLYQISEQKSDEENSIPISAFLNILENKAGEIARTDQLFAE